MVTAVAVRSRCPLSTAILVVLTALGLTALPGCKREERRFHPPPAATPGSAGPASPLQPGPPVQALSVPSPFPGQGPYEENAYGVSEGKTLYNQFNCSGCHSQGGGGMGPPLMDDEWLYGSKPENIFRTIVQGRPNGMPAFGNKIVSDQVWQIVAYVRSMSGLLRKDVAPGRDDAMYLRSQEQATRKAHPVPKSQP
jgi:cytochrome c oxidase cbb3-type subunit III